MPSLLLVLRWVCELSLSRTNANISAVEAETDAWRTHGTRCEGLLCVYKVSKRSPAVSISRVLTSVIACREGNYAPVRLVSFDSLLLLKGLKETSILTYLFAVIENDQSPIVRRHVAQSLIYSMPLLAAIDDLGIAAASDALIEIEEIEDLAQEAPKFNSEFALEALRKEYGKIEIIGDILMQLLT